MSVLDELAAAERSTPDARRPRPAHPAGWEPGVRLEADGTGTITSRPSTHQAPEWRALLTEWGFNPDDYEIVDDTVQVRTWDAVIGGGETRQMWYHRANVRRITPGDTDVDYRQLLSEIRRHRRHKTPAPVGEHALVVALADWQLGKRDGDGTEGIVARVLRAVDLIEDHTRALRRSGVTLDRLVVAGLGDLVEGCGGNPHYPNQDFTVQLDRRQQVKVARRLLTKAITRWAPLYGHVVVVAVPGNHGENRSAGRAVTTWGDNDDVAVFEQVAEILAQSDTYRHVSFVIPDEEQTVTLDVCGTIVGFTHGHHQERAGGSGTGPQKVWRWWEHQAHGMRPVGDATILLTGHFHHLSVVSNGPRTHIQAPTLDGGSTYFAEKSGLDSTPGTLTFTVGPDGWDNLKIHA